MFQLPRDYNQKQEENLHREPQIVSVTLIPNGAKIWRSHNLSVTNTKFPGTQIPCLLIEMFRNSNYGELPDCTGQRKSIVDP